jgi:hypothetical protein
MIYLESLLYMSFSATEFCQNISHLKNTISLAQKWMSSNPSKIEFLIIGLRYFCFEVPNYVKKLNYSLKGKIVRHPTSIHLNYHEYGS